MEIISIVASIVSVLIGIFAIWLSVTFYKLSNKITEDTKEASKGISASVDRLESLFDRLYADTFSMMKDTVSDMRKHMWPEKENSDEAILKIEKKADEKIDAMKNDLGKELSVMMRQVGKTDDKIALVESRLTELIDKAIQRTREVEVETQEELSLSDVLNRIISLIQMRGSVTVRKLLLGSLGRRYSRSMINEALQVLLRDKIITMSGPIEESDTEIKMRV